MARRDDIVLAAHACRFPDAETPEALLANSLEGRQSFRAIPPERLALSDYDRRRIGEADSITQVPAGLLTDWQFDTARFRVPRAAFAAADPAHWLALEVAADAIEAAGGPGIFDLDSTAVIVANTLTGEFSRAALLRLRWPWLDRQLASALNEAGAADVAAAVRRAFQARVTGSFPEPDEESLAGGLANTIAGRIANHFDLRGGAWSIDGACASSLVAMANAAELIAGGRASAVVVAAVDLSLDPFELVGFSRNGALAKIAMRVFDRRAEGFWPGEGAGAVVLMASEQARRKGVAAGVSLAGWGVASDGHGGLTRPDMEGQRWALQRAYAHAAIDPVELGYVEAHGTGTAVGDPIEVRALAAVAGDRDAPLPIASIKGNIGHTKAAAGLAGLIRTIEAVTAGLVPPHSGCEEPHPVFAEIGGRVRVSDAPSEWRGGARRVAGVSSFGFGGINAHVVIARDRPRRASAIPAKPPARDAELFLFRAADAATLRANLAALAVRAPSLSLVELSDAAAFTAGRLTAGGLRLAFVASSPAQLTERLEQSLAAIESGSGAVAGIHVGQPARPPRIGFLFPGQAAPVRLDGGAWERRFPGRYRFGPEPADADSVRTDIAQPAIIAASMAGSDLFKRLGISATAAIGHSLGELAALAWAGAIDRKAVVDLAAQRGRAMAAVPRGGMVSLGCDAAAAAELAKGLPIGLACLNAPGESVLSGDETAVDIFMARARRAGVNGVRLKVSHAFHSPMMEAAAPTWRELLKSVALRPLQRPIASTVTGRWLDSRADLAALLVEQLTAPVRFTAAASLVAEVVDAFVEVGPGAGLARLVPGPAPVASLDVFSGSMVPALQAVAQLFVLGCDVDPAILFEGPGIRAFAASAPTFLASPCGIGRVAGPPPPPARDEQPVPAPQPSEPSAILSTLVRMVADETGLDPSGLSPEHRFLDDLHLNSLAVSRLVARLARALGRAPVGFATAFANARLIDVAASFAEAASLMDSGERPRRIEGAGRWVRRFTLGFDDAPVAPENDVVWQRTDLGSANIDAATGLAEGLAIILSPWNSERDTAALFGLCRQAVGRFRHLALCHDGAPLGGFARSIAAEGLFDSVRLIAHAPASRLEEVLARHVAGFEEYCFDARGEALMPKLVVSSDEEGREAVPPRVVLVTGGARGIGAECAIRLAERSGAAIIMVGRKPVEDRDVGSTLDRLIALGVEARYIQADVADADALRSAVADVAAELGAVTHLVHAAGINEPMPFRDVDARSLARTLAPKTRGLVAAVDACGPSLVRVVAFGSIIARLGLKGEAHYALANAEQTRLLESVAKDRPDLSALSIEWSVWSGAGMGERIGVIDRLEAAGIDSLSLDDALDEFEALALGDREGAVIVTSRFGAVEPLPAGTVGRFLDRVLLHTPGVELVVETHLGMGRDAYLDDHRLGGAAVVPGVMLIEMMAQTAAALDPGCAAGFDALRFEAALDVGHQDVAVRIAALRRKDGSIGCEIRSGRDGYATLHASARLRPPPRRPRRQDTPAVHSGATGLYGPLFFQGPLFQTVEGLGELTSRTVSARLQEGGRRQWFGGFEEPSMRLGDPGRRDAALHLLQCCIPDRRLIPVSARAVDIFGGTPRYVRAVERWSRDPDHAFDILLMDEGGRIVERWREAVFRTVGAVDIGPVLEAVPELTVAYIERRARAVTGDDTLTVAIVADADVDQEDRRARAAAAFGLGPPLRRGDGRPLAGYQGRHVSFSHSGGVTIAVGSALKIGCDIERAAEFAAAELARTWTAEEVLRKLGSRASARRLGEGDAAFSGDGQERIVSLGPLPSRHADALVVAVGAVGDGRP